MGKLILCYNAYAKTPFLFKETNTKVYTIEEMCYYIYNNIYTIMEETFDDMLYEWIEEQLQMPLLKNKLLSIQMEEHSLKDLVVVVLCSCDYFNEQEIRELVDIMHELENLSMQQRKKLKADNLLVAENYGLALEEYETMLNGENAKYLTTEEYGDVLHNIAVIHTRFNLFVEAAVLFKETYSRNQNKESLKQYLTSLKMARKNELLEDEMNHFDVEDDIILEMNKSCEVLDEKAKETRKYQEIDKLLALKEEGMVSEYYEKIDQLLNQWKKEYRLKLGR